MPVWTDLPGVLEVDIPDSVMASGDEVRVVQPAGGVGLSHILAMPNPARSGVRLVTAACAGEITFEIFDIRGRLVAAVVKGAGARSAEWDLTNTSGNRVTPGLYLATARGTPAPQARKIIVLR